MRFWTRVIASVLFLLMSFAGPAAGVQYFCDDLNRLVRVINDDGTAIRYSYDEAGNRTTEIMGRTIPTRQTSPLQVRPFPADPWTYLSIPNIIWVGGGDPDGDSVTYEVYADTSGDPTTLIGAWVPGSSFTPTQALNCNTTYQWKVVATEHRASSIEHPALPTCNPPA